jgi:orotate phosphoribosyltransferase
MDEVIDILKKVGAFLTDGHFVGVSGLHFDTYINKDFLYPHTRETSYICKLLAEKYKDKNIEVVVGPALGGIVLAQWTAHHLSEIYGKEVLGIYTEKSPDSGQSFTRGYEQYVKGKNVLVVEDIVTTGGSILKVVKAVQDAGGDVVGTCAVVDKSDGKFKIDALMVMAIENYNSAECPMCKKGIPINTKVGHGKKFLENK